MAIEVRLENVTKRFESVVAVDDVTIDVDGGEFYTVLGPSGCGKTTTLRIIAGFTSPDEGRVFFGERDITSVPPHKRGTGMVFQNYAIWPHMNVFENVAYGLKVRRAPREGIRKRVSAALHLVGLEGFENRLPSQLSGGQQQRVALARAIVVEPEVLLLDEPLSNLDAKLRVATRAELTKLQKRLNITSIYVTHDQEEALSISDRIAVMDRGRVVQIGTPREIYENPQSKFVADFIGIANFIRARVRRIRNGSLELETSTGKPILIAGDAAAIGSELLLVIRPESFQLLEGRKTDVQTNALKGKIWHLSYMGDVIRYEIQTDSVEGGILRTDVHHPVGRKLPSEGEEATVYFAPEDARIVKES